MHVPCAILLRIPVLALLLAGALQAGALSVGASSVQSVTNATAASSNGSSSSSAEGSTIVGRRDRPLPPPRLAAPAIAPATVRVACGRGLAAEDRAWLEAVAGASAARFACGRDGLLVVAAGDFRRLARRGDGAQVVDGTLLVAPEALRARDARAVELALARAAWDRLGTAEQAAWRGLAGWSRNPVLPVVETSRGAAGTLRGDGAREDFAVALLAWSGPDPAEPSRSAFLAQLTGAELPAAPPAELADLRVNLAFVGGAGIAGSSQGHVALVLEEPGRTTAVAYLSEYDWSRPVRSGLRSLAGVARRRIEVSSLDELRAQYAAEGRTVTLAPLDLSAEETHRLCFRLEENLRLEHGRYSFLRQNCAAPLRDLLAYATAGRARGLARWHTPHSLYLWARAGRGGAAGGA